MQRKYDRQHRRIRAKWDPIVNSGEAVCPRCKKPIRPYEPWDLDHDDSDPTHRRYLGASHRRCNRAEPLQRLHRQANMYRAGPYGPAELEPKPKVDRFDGLPDPTPDDPNERWSRHCGGPAEFNPRCRDCRERRSACDRVLKWQREEAEAA
jgi:hypothetical protein